MAVAKKPRVVIIGAGLAGLAAAHRLHAAAVAGLFDVLVLEASDRIGGRIWTSEFAGDRVELGATWIHGIDGSPLYEIAHKAGALDPDSRPYERMDGSPGDPIIVAEGGGRVDPSIVTSITDLFSGLKASVKSGAAINEGGDVSIGSFLRRGLEAHRGACGGGGRTAESSLQDAVFATFENTERIYSAVDNLDDLDLAAESGYQELPGDHISIPRGYSQIVEHLAAGLPPGTIHLNTQVRRVEWRSADEQLKEGSVKLHLDGDDSIIIADHVIVTVSLGVLKAGLEAGEEPSDVAKGGGGLVFQPELPAFKRDAIRRLGFGLVDKLFAEIDASEKFQYVQLAFNQGEGSAGHASLIPWWMRKSSLIWPIYGGSNVIGAWFVGREAAQVEAMDEEEVARGFQATLDAFGYGAGGGATKCGTTENGSGSHGMVRRVTWSRWGSDPLYLGSYSYVAVGSSADDLDSVAEPLPRMQVLFAGEATHRTHYSSTHGAYFSGIREAERLLTGYVVPSS